MHILLGLAYIALLALAGGGSAAQDFSFFWGGDGYAPPQAAAPEERARNLPRFAESARREAGELRLLFGGDIMAHRPNYSMKDFSMIYKEIAPVVSDSDLAFANIEAPVADALGFDTYPNFNMKNSYPLAAVDAGFNVFSLANNHSNDKLGEGIAGTRAFFKGLEAGNSGRKRRIYACGLKSQANGPLTYRIIEERGWKILFVAVTEYLNRPDARAYIDYVPMDSRSRAAFKKELSALIEKSGCDLTVVSVHSGEAEYIAPVLQDRRDWYREILDLGADIIWANHPHVTREWEIFASEEDGSFCKMVMYGMGNMISAQRFTPDFANPQNSRDDTGDGVLLSVRLKRNWEGRPVIVAAEPTYITTYIDPQRNFVIRQLDDNLIEEFRAKGDAKHAGYFEARKKITTRISGKIVWVQE